MGEALNHARRRAGGITFGGRMRNVRSGSGAWVIVISVILIAAAVLYWLSDRRDSATVSVGNADITIRGEGVGQAKDALDDAKDATANTAERAGQAIENAGDAVRRAGEDVADRVQ